MDMMSKLTIQAVVVLRSIEPHRLRMPCALLHAPAGGHGVSIEVVDENGEMPFS